MRSSSNDRIEITSLDIKHNIHSRNLIASCFADQIIHHLFYYTRTTWKDVYLMDSPSLERR